MASVFPGVKTVLQALSAGLLQVTGWIFSGFLKTRNATLDWLHERYPDASWWAIGRMYDRVEAAHNAGQTLESGGTVRIRDIPTGATVPPGERFRYDVTVVFNHDWTDEEGFDHDFSFGDNYIIYSNTLLTTAEIREMALDHLKNAIGQHKADYELPPDVDFESMMIYISAITRSH